MGDELFSWWACRGDLAELLRVACEDVHPPIFYVCLKIWQTATWSNIGTLRVFSGLCAILTVWLAGKLFTSLQVDCSRSQPPYAVWLLLGFNGATIGFAHYARMYSMMGLFAVLVSMAGLKCLRHPERTACWLALIVTTVLMAMLHHFAAIFAGIIFLWMAGELLIARPVPVLAWQRLGFAIVVFGTLIIPTAFVAWRQVHEVHADYWIKGEGWATPGIALAGYFIPEPSVYFRVPAELSLLALAVFGWILLRVRQSSFERLVAMQLSIASGLMLAASWLGDRPVFQSRYLHCLHPLLCLFAIRAIESLRDGTIKRFAMLVFSANTFLLTVALVVYSLTAKPVVDLRHIEAIYPDVYQRLLTAPESRGTRFVFVDPIAYMRFKYYCGDGRPKISYWDPAVESSTGKHVVYLSAIDPGIRLEKADFESLPHSRMIVIGEYTTQTELPGWVPDPVQPTWNLWPLGVKVYVRESPLDFRSLPPAPAEK